MSNNLEAFRERELPKTLLHNKKLSQWIKNLSKKKRDCLEKIRLNTVTNDDLIEIKKFLQELVEIPLKSKRNLTLLEKCKDYIYHLESILIESLGSEVLLCLSPITAYIKNCIEVFSDLKRQRKGWILGESSAKTLSWKEEFSNLFDSLCFEDYLRENKNKLPKNLFDILEKLRAKIDIYEGQETNLEVLKDPKWLEIVEISKEVIKIWDNEKFDKK